MVFNGILILLYFFIKAENILNNNEIEKKLEKVNIQCQNFDFLEQN